MRKLFSWSMAPTGKNHKLQCRYPMVISRWITQKPSTFSGTEICYFKCFKVYSLCSIGMKIKKAMLLRGLWKFRREFLFISLTAEWIVKLKLLYQILEYFEFLAKISARSDFPNTAKPCHLFSRGQNPQTNFITKQRSGSKHEIVTSLQNLTWGQQTKVQKALLSYRKSHCMYKKLILLNLP